mmetsp:Transcript_20692/g.20036  ORF Transcript_20692/g.20036 Transcript_20692/m.20036 type:complete len:99 (+) Transcript_20692:82-378(+)|eukprot:CAMPEP_0119034274 /NCGR_PEP_ID=MMETSP1177-20130426/1277_1 /TAXON_ID=2985 /ORGANISM="Ochromonas sp, Strain CCMP1899" /LENGTH=98 /DNA_ID=CAMNT_0006991599 /DNA_START=66 /DNA_END=362 /DNA_ORIENTATION=-
MAERLGVKLRDMIKTTPHDKVHFPATNQAHYCWQKYNEYILCLKRNELDEDVCMKQKQLAYSICPDDWTTEWKEQRSGGTFLGVQEQEPVKEENGHGH